MAGSENSDIVWDGLISADATNELPWALLTGGGSSAWGRQSPHAMPHHSSLLQSSSFAAPATLRLCAEECALRACRMTTSACARISLADDGRSAKLTALGSAGLVRVNDQWIEEGECVDVVAGDSIELSCVEHAPMRTTSGLYLPACCERRGSKKDRPTVAFQAWRFVPQDQSLKMLSPTEDAKHFFPCMACAPEEYEQPLLQTESANSSDAESEEAHAAKRPRQDDEPGREDHAAAVHHAVHLRLAGVTRHRSIIRKPRTSRALPKLADAESWW